MRASYAATNNDLQNVEAWAALVDSILDLMPPDQRVEVLNLALKNEKAARERTVEALIESASMSCLSAIPEFKYGNAVKRLCGLVVQVLTRHVVNDASEEEAAAILFAQQKYGHGDGRLLSYLDGLPGFPTKRRK